MSKDATSYSGDDGLAEEFIGWTTESVFELRQLVDALVEGEVRDSDPVNRVYDLTHNIKGIGASFDFLLMTSVGASLCTYLKDCAFDTVVSKRVLDAHIRTFEVILHHKIKGRGGEQGVALERRLAAIIQEETKT